MLGGNKLTNPFQCLSIKSLLSNYNMLSFFKKFCTEITSRIWKYKKPRNYKYCDLDFLKVFFLSEVLGRSIHDTSEMLNEHEMRNKKGRRKIFTDGRKRRLVPHQTEVNKFLKQIGLQRARNILRECLNYQLTEALNLNIISRKVHVLIDFTEHPYYGKREDKMIKGTNRQRGTLKMRHYLGFSILSRDTHLYAGLEHIATGQSKIPIIIQFLDNLLNLGFELGYVLMDREFYRAELFDYIKKKGGNGIIPAKQYKKIRGVIEEYVKGIGGRVRKYTFSTATEAKRKFSTDVYLIIKAKRGFSLQEVKRDFKKERITLNDARHRVFTIMTTEKPKGKESSWASRVALFYRRRWLIETGFSDLNRINRRWKSNHDNVKYLDILVRMMLYNSWKMNKKLIEIVKNKDHISMAWTLNQNQDYLKEAFLSLKKKSQGVIG